MTSLLVRLLSSGVPNSHKAPEGAHTSDIKPQLELVAQPTRQDGVSMTLAADPKTPANAAHPISGCSAGTSIPQYESLPGITFPKRPSLQLPGFVPSAPASPADKGATPTSGSRPTDVSTSVSPLCHPGRTRHPSDRRSLKQQRFRADSDCDVTDPRNDDDNVTRPAGAPALVAWAVKSGDAEGPQPHCDQGPDGTRLRGGRREEEACLAPGNDGSIAENDIPQLRTANDDDGDEAGEPAAPAKSAGSMTRPMSTNAYGDPNSDKVGPTHSWTSHRHPGRVNTSSSTSLFALLRLSLPSLARSSRDWDLSGGSQCAEAGRRLETERERCERLSREAGRKLERDLAVARERAKAQMARRPG